MQISLKPSLELDSLRTDCLAVPVNTGATNDSAKSFDAAFGGVISALKKQGDLPAAGTSLVVPLLTGTSVKRAVLLGTGKTLKMDANQGRKFLSALGSALTAKNISSAALTLDALEISGVAQEDLLERIARQCVTAKYKYAKTLSNPAKPSTLKKLVIEAAATAVNKRAAAQGVAVGNGINLARELGDLPANICTPTYLATQARNMAKGNDQLKVTVLDEAKMKSLGMNSLLSVTAGTKQPAKLIQFEYKGGKKDAKPHVLVGKGITFDSGGISLKPGAKMDEMKFDMCGAASVFGAMATIAELSPKVNINAVVAACENMPSGTATKPGDVIKSMSGQTIEVLNTDAEGRLVLCDALTYVERFNPASVIDIATLTGACVVALGKHASAVYSNNDDFAQTLLDAGNAADDRGWPMPLWDDYQQQLNSNFADMGNIGGPEAGSVTAACFLSRFTKKYRWAHLDIAGTAWLGGGAKGATGRPVAMLTRYLLDQA